MDTVIAYIVTFVGCYFSLTGIPQMIVGGLIVRLIGPSSTLIALTFGGYASWMLVAFLWKWLEGGLIPIAALVGAVGFHLLHGTIMKNELTPQSIRMMQAETLGIALVGMNVAFLSRAIRWY